MSAESRVDKIAGFCADHDLPWDEERAAAMTRYLDLLLQFNEAMNLIGPLSEQEVVDQLLVDSLVAAAARRPKGPILDVGTGAGLPGIPLKIVFPDCPISLVEPRRKRSTFLKIVTHRLNLDDVTVFRGRIEDFDGGDFDFVISKAFRAPVEWLETAKPYLADGGAVVCMAREGDRAGLEEKAGALGMSLAGEAAGRGDGAERRVCFAFG